MATLLHEGGVPVARTSDQLGPADPALTARVYLGRDFGGDKSDLAHYLWHCKIVLSELLPVLALIHSDDQ